MRKRCRNIEGISGEKEKNTGKIPNGLKISRGTLSTKSNKKTYKLHQKRLRKY